MTTYNQDLLIAAHNQSIRHREDIVNSENCGCFYCLTIFTPIQILEWVDDDQTALCPNCDVDAVIGEKSGYPVSDLNFLEQMHRYFF